MPKQKSNRKPYVFFTVLLFFLIAAIAFLILNPTILHKIQHLFLQTNKKIEWTDATEYDLMPYQLTEQTDWQEKQNLMLINAEHPLPENFAADLAEYRDSGVLMNEVLLSSYGALSDTILEETNTRMYVSSLYRSIAEQAEIYAEDPIYALPPGYSEHHTGLAIDVYVEGFAGENFINCPAGQFVDHHAAKFGFIVRYPEGKEDITKIPYEPWHIRYVGLPHSLIMAQNFWTLEEYIESLKPGHIYTSGTYIVSRQKPDEMLMLPENISKVSYSYDNTGYIILTANIS